MKTNQDSSPSKAAAQATSLSAPQILPPTEFVKAKTDFSIPMSSELRGTIHTLFRVQDKMKCTPEQKKKLINTLKNCHYERPELCESWVKWLKVHFK